MTNVQPTAEPSADEQDIALTLGQIEALPVDWHGVGTVTSSALRAIARHAGQLGRISHSVETGCGKTTLLFSHLSADHTVFAIDEGLSVTRARTSSILNAGSVTFIEGLTQATLPRHDFGPGARVQLALIDGPHGYPFPDLEYFYFYPLIEPGGLLLLDDIKIPTIQRMFDIIRAEDTFRLLEVVDENLAFFQRTDSADAGLTSDSWWRQGYNRAYYAQLTRPPVDSRHAGAFPGLRNVYRGLSQNVPEGLKSIVPRSLRDKVWRVLEQ